jgi:hypothetical protein
MAESLGTEPMTEELASFGAKACRETAPRVLFVIPGDGSGSSMIFIRRQIDSLGAAGDFGACYGISRPILSMRNTAP